MVDRKGDLYHDRGMATTTNVNEENPVIELPPAQPKKINILKTILLGVLVIAVLYGLYVFISYWQAQEKMRLEKERAQRIYNSIPVEYAHFSYEEATPEAKITDMFYPKAFLQNLSKESTFSARIEQVIAKNGEKKDVHLVWDKIDKAIKYYIFIRKLKDVDYLITSLSTTDTFAVISTPRFQDQVFKIRACKVKNECVESREIFLPQEQHSTFGLTFTPKDSYNMEFVWQRVPTALKYNIFTRTTNQQEYDRAFRSTQYFTAQISLPQVDSYFIVQACNTAICYTSDEIFVGKKQ